MKSLVLGGIVAALIVIACGCKTVPSTEKMYSTAHSIGVAAGIVAGVSKIDDESRNAVVSIVKEVSTCVPGTNESFSVAWTPMAQAHTGKLVSAGKINAQQETVILAAFNVAVRGVDYIFTVRYPRAREFTDVVSAAVDGFTTGFLAVFKPAGSDEDVCGSGTKCDEDAMQFLSEK